MKKISHLKAKYRYSIILLKQLVKTDFKVRYQNSVLGYLWSLLRPLALFFILYIVFVKFLKVGQSLPHFPVYLLLGIVLWNFFVEVTTSGVGAIVGKGDILRKISFPRYVIIVASSVSAFINLLLNFIVVAIFMIVARIVPPIQAIILVPLLVGELFILALSVGFYLSAAFVRYRDVSYIWDVIIQGAFYATPIIYPVSKVPEWAGKILLINPVAQIIQDIRYVLVTDQSQTIGSLYGSWWFRLIPLGIVLIVTIFAATYFKQRSKDFAEEV